MTNPSNVDGFRQLFAGRAEVRGALAGGCIRSRSSEDWDNHLNGVESLGIYPLIPYDKLHGTDKEDADELAMEHSFTSTLWVRWGCSDIDDHTGTRQDEVAEETYRLMEASIALGLVLHVEITKSNGRHLWLFTETVVPAEVMRRAFLAIHQAAGVRPTEVNPKQTSVEHLKEGFGNYVNLPYFGDSDRRVMLYSDGQPETLEEFLEDAITNRVPFTDLLAAARLYVEPPPKAVVNIGEYDGALEPLVTRLNGYAFKIFRDGPPEWKPDRSDTLARLAHKVRESGLTPTECFALLKDADRRWGKFYDRSDGDEQLQRLVSNAY